MAWKSRLLKPVARVVSNQLMRAANRPIASQTQIFQTIVTKAKDTQFGLDHKFAGVNTYEEFKQAVPIQDYEGLRPYVDRIRQGEL